MPRGGRREGAGRKTQWESGCTFAETTVIRVPKVLRDEILELAHRLDAGEEIDLEAKSIKKHNKYLESKVLDLQRKLQEIESKPRQLEIGFRDSEFWDNFKRNILKSLEMGSQSKIYKRLEKALNKEISRAT